mgnify:CR=1 FL=1
MKSGLFKYVAHPDIILVGYQTEDDFIYKHIVELCKASIKYNVPLEINLAGALRHLQYGCSIEQCDEVYYPFARFWKIVGDMKAPVVLGIDAHKPEELLNPPLSVAENYISRFNLKVIEKLNMEINHF